MVGYLGPHILLRRFQSQWEQQTNTRWTLSMCQALTKELICIHACACPPLSPGINPTRLSKSLRQVVLPIEFGFSKDSVAPVYTPSAAPLWSGVGRSQTVCDRGRETERTSGQVMAESREVQAPGLGDPFHKSRRGKI